MQFSLWKLFLHFFYFFQFLIYFFYSAFYAFVCNLHFSSFCSVPVDTVGRIPIFSFIAPRLLGFSGAYSFFSFFYAPAARLLRGVFFLFLLLRPGCSASPGRILSFPSSTPRLLGFPGAYSFFSFFYAPAARLLRGLFLLFLFLRPGCSASPGLISYSDTHTVAFHGGQRLLSGLRSRWCSTREPWRLRGVVGSQRGDVRRNCCGHRR